MKKYLATYRPANLIFIAVAQWLSAYFLDFSSNPLPVAETGIYWLMLGTAACASFGYWLNDFTDQKRDAINQKESSYVSQIGKYALYMHLLLFCSIILEAGNRLGLWFVYLFLAVLAVLTLYNLLLKNVALVGNLVVSALCFMSIYAVSLIHISEGRFFFLHFALLAGLVTLCRELVKDAEDMKGDAQTGGHTFPIVFGTKTLNMTVYIIILLIVSLAIVSLHYQATWFNDVLKYVYYTYFGLFVIVPLYKVAIDVRYAKTKEDYAQLSKVLKYVLFTGILSILFF